MRPEENGTHCWACDHMGHYHSEYNNGCVKGCPGSVSFVTREAMYERRLSCAYADNLKLEQESADALADAVGWNGLFAQVASILGCNARGDKLNNEHVIERARYLSSMFTGDRYVATERAERERNALRTMLVSVRDQLDNGDLNRSMSMADHLTLGNLAYVFQLIEELRDDIDAALAPAVIAEPTEEAKAKS